MAAGPAVLAAEVDDLQVQPVPGVLGESALEVPLGAHDHPELTDPAHLRDQPTTANRACANIQPLLALLDDANSRLASAKRNHETAQGDYDHARDIAMAGAAQGYAKAADIFHLQVLAK